MDELWRIAPAGAAAAGLLMLLCWAASLRMGDASIVDRVWGLGFVVQVWAYAMVIEHRGILPWLLVALVSLWGGRLSLHIHLRNRGHGEDYRYARMRAQHGRHFWWYSLFSVFLLQGVIGFVVAAPLLWVMAFQLPLNGSGVVMVGVVVWLVGFGFEAVGDWQLSRFRSNPANRGRLLTTGLWSLTRHPNYFGDAMLWWGYYLIAVSVPGGWVTAFGPLIMTLLIRYVSGVAMLDRDQIAKRPAYADYIRSTPAFLPRLWRP